MKLVEAFENFRMSKIGVNKPSTITWYEQRLKSKSPARSSAR